MRKAEILIVYSSRTTGNSRKIAEHLAREFGDEAVLYPVGEAPDPAGFAYVIMGFGIYHGWPDGDMRAFMQRCRSQKTGLFITLGAYPDSDHAKTCMGRAEGLMQSCTVYGRFICHGKLDPAMVARMRERSTGPHSWNEERAERVKAAESHPDDNDLRSASEIFSAAWRKIKSGVFPAKEKETSRAVLLAAFGTSQPGADAAYRQIEAQVINARPDVELRWAYSSGRVRAKLKSSGELKLSVAAALNQLLVEGFTDVEVIPVYMTPGEEYHKIARDVNAFHNGALKFDRLNLALPLLSNAAKLQKVCRAVITEIPLERAENEAVIFMGHGNHSGRCDMHYLAAAAEFQHLDKNIFLAAVEGVPAFADIKDELRKKGIDKAWLMPFMIVAGDHACNDLAGEAEDSWKSQLEAAGIECRVIMRGLGEYPAVASLFIGN